MTRLAVIDRRSSAIRDAIHDGQGGIQEELGSETGKPYRTRTWASRVGNEVLRECRPSRVAF